MKFIKFFVKGTDSKGVLVRPTPLPYNVSTQSKEGYTEVFFTDKVGIEIIKKAELDNIGLDFKDLPKPLLKQIR